MFKEAHKSGPFRERQEFQSDDLCPLLAVVCVSITPAVRPFLRDGRSLWLSKSEPGTWDTNDVAVTDTTCKHIRAAALNNIGATRCFRCYGFVVRLDVAVGGTSMRPVVRGPKARRKHVTQHTAHSIATGGKHAFFFFFDQLAQKWKRSIEMEKVKEKWRTLQFDGFFCCLPLIRQF